MNDKIKTDTEHREKLAKMIKDIDFGMLTTQDEDGTLRSRPMSVNRKVDFDGDLWFFTYGNSHKVIEAKKHPQVNVSFADNSSNAISDLLRSISSSLIDDE